jgi:predicted metal-dependent phosphoesterase TrpH
MWSGDSSTTPEELEQAVVASGLDVLCITDHNAIKGAVELEHALPCRVIVGEEVRTSRGELIGLFLRDRIPFGLSPEEAAHQIRDQGGLVYVPHPFDPLRHNLAEDALRALAAQGLVDAIEGFNAKTSLAHLNRAGITLAKEVGVPAGAGSDAHVPDALGAAYVEMDDFAGPQEFVTALVTANLVGHHWDQARPWRARIIPSTSAS